jgi:hypothetical protein
VLNHSDANIGLLLGRFATHQVPSELGIRLDIVIDESRGLHRLMCPSVFGKVICSSSRHIREDLTLVEKMRGRLMN